MFRRKAFCLWVLLCLIHSASHAQTADTAADKLLKFPSKVLGRMQSKMAALNKQVTRQTERYLRRMERQEDRLHSKLSATDSAAAKTLFAHSKEQYAAWRTRIQTDTGSRNGSGGGEYKPYEDTLRGALLFLQKNSVSGGDAVDPARLQGAVSQLQVLQAKMQDEDQIRDFLQQRKQQIGDYISQHTSMEGLLGKDYTGMKENLYYYSQQAKQYKEMLNDPDKLEKGALDVLSRLPAFQQFMKQNSQLAGLFGLPANYGTPAGLTGLQTRDQVAQLVQGQVSAAGAGGAQALQADLQSASSQLDGYKDKLSQLGAGSGNMDMPDFQPNDQKTKTFWHRLQYGSNLQTTRNNYYFPTVTDLGFSLGYKLGHSNVIGVGASYKLGWGNGIQHIALSSQGAGLRSFINIKIKNSFSATGGFEYNYTVPFTSYQDLRRIEDWTKSGLIGITKTVSMKSRFFKQSTLSLLWDFLSYQQAPQTQPVIFRIGYVW